MNGHSIILICATILIVSGEMSLELDGLLFGTQHLENHWMTGNSLRFVGFLAFVASAYWICGDEQKRERWFENEQKSHSER
jgi:hypothetical protein